MTLNGINLKNYKLGKLPVNFLLVASAFLCLFASVLYAFEWDWASAFTMWPPWCWAALGVLAGTLKNNYGWKKSGLPILIAWILFLGLFADETSYPIRLFRHHPTQSRKDSGLKNGVIRIVSINCSVGQERVAQEAKAWDPDIVLLQESPYISRMPSLAEEFFGKEGGWVCGHDTAILARGRCIDQGDEIERRSIHHTRAHVELQDGTALEVVSIHLIAPSLRYDLLYYQAWQECAGLDRERRKYLSELMSKLNSKNPEATVILGGDFNVPGYDGILSELKPRLHDSFREHGVGWGHTGLNEMPVIRVDQIWLSKDLKSIGCMAVRTVYSDHRMVVCDVMKLRK
ncbi:MAG TPA: hypothetical protein DCZ94_07465 [Lentisphaeria bacterium]|nr:MAG: hypothetical protein A2X48_00990 [Lentisphaerae bacterium GWF2_49_21]HBC86774.1 hypothetical protein [Lentisphaeria bacterium]